MYAQTLTAAAPSSAAIAPTAALGNLSHADVPVNLNQWGKGSQKRLSSQ